ncbi:hypothetical protein ACTFIR_005732 [Dictyostelium discoideum]
MNKRHILTYKVFIDKLKYRNGSYFVGSALTTFIQQSKAVENYGDLKKELVKRVSDIEIKKSIDEGAPKQLDEAIEIALNNNIQEQQPQIQQQQVLRPTKIPHLQCKEEINTITEQVSFTTNQQDLKRVSLYGVLLINDQPTRCLIGTGSTITMIHESFAKHLNVKLESCDKYLRAANGSKINIKGKTNLNIAIGKVKYTVHNVFVTSNFEFKCLPGINTLKMMKATLDIGIGTLSSGGDDINLFTYGSIPSHPREERWKDEVVPRKEQATVTKDQVSLSKEEFESYIKDKEVKEEIKEGLLKLKFPDEVSKSQAVPLIIKYQDVFTNTLIEPGVISGVEHQIKLNQKDASFQAYPYKIIREYNSPVSSSVVLRPKPDGSMRMCINYTKLNNITIYSGYYQIPIREGDIYLTAFLVPQGLFEFNVMPFGLCNAPAVFQRTIHKIFKEENRHTLHSFYDDILSHSKSVMDHTPH